VSLTDRFTAINAQTKINSIADAIVHPTKLLGRRPENMSAGVQTRDRSFDPAAGLTRKYQNGENYTTACPDPVAHTKTHHATGFFGGILDGRYGHFLLESLSRLYCRANFPDHPVIWSARCDVPQPGLHPWQTDLLDMLGVAGPHVVATEPCRVSQLVIAPPGYVIQHDFTPVQQDFLAKVPWCPEPGRKTWLSRRGQARRSLAAMIAFEETLRTEGWTIIEPETLSVRDQLALYASSERIAGPIGSALHSLILLRDVAGLRVDLFVPNPFGAEDQINQNYITIARAKGFTQKVHFIPSAPFMERQNIGTDAFIHQLRSCLNA